LYKLRVNNIFLPPAYKIERNEMFGLLRLLRGILGFIAVLQVNGLLPVLSWLEAPAAVDGNMIAIFIVKLFLMAMSFGAFFGLRSLINKLHVKHHGVDHPALVKKWAL